MLTKITTQMSYAAILIFIALLQPAATGSSKVVDCPDVPGDGVLPPEPESNTQNPLAGFISVAGSRPSLVVYEDRNGAAVFEGDIVLGTTVSMQQSMPGHAGVRGIVLSGPIQWPSTTIPYEIDPNLPNPVRVTAAITEWATKTNLQFAPHAGETDFIYFTVGTGCDSALGHQGGEQLIHLAAGCATPQVIHEIGHAVGLLHEHTRSDRDQYIQITLTKVNALHTFANLFCNAQPLVEPLWLGSTGEVKKR